MVQARSVLHQEERAEEKLEVVVLEIWRRSLARLVLCCTRLFQEEEIRRSERDPKEDEQEERGSCTQFQPAVEIQRIKDDIRSRHI